MMKFACSSIVLSSSLVVCFALLSPPRHRIEKGSVERIRPGMNQQQVEAILGGPPGDYGPESVAAELSGGVVVPQFPEKEETWIAGYIAISVLFDADGKVVQTRESARLVGEETWVSRARRWLNMR